MESITVLSVCVFFFKVAPSLSVHSQLLYFFHLPIAKLNNTKWSGQKKSPSAQKVETFLSNMDSLAAKEKAE